MAKVTFMQADGSSIEADIEEGTSVMLGALTNNVPGIVGDCGGACSCATCHVYIGEDWREKVGEADEFEEGMLEFAENRKDASRLCCQITVTEELDGLSVQVPSSGQQNYGWVSTT